MNTRARSAEIIALILKGHSLSEILPTIEQTELIQKDKSFIKALCFGTCRYYPRLLSWLNYLMDKPLKKGEKLVEALLCIGLFQIEYMEVSTHAAIFETVQAARMLNKLWAVKLINGVLREATRRQAQLQSITNDTLVAQYAHPQWLIEVIKKDWSDAWPAILGANNQHPPLFLRINKQQTTRPEYQKKLEKSNIESLIHPYCPEAIVLTKPQDIQTLPGFHQGYFSVQDASAQFVPELLKLAHRQRILDACAAPGGKTCHLLEQGLPFQEVVALEIDVTRVVRLQQNLSRLKLAATVRHKDALELETWWDDVSFDRILIDAPCSGSGVIRRHPDIKLLRRATDIPVLNEVQARLLRKMWTVLKPGGLLLYVTCSVLNSENDDVIHSFMKDNPDAELVTISLPYGQACAYGWQILPGQEHSDGFYFSRLRKTIHT